MKKLIVLLSIMVFLVTGCSINVLSSSDISKNMEMILSDTTKLYNVNFEGYKYYIPKGLKFVEKNDYNAIMNDRFGNKYYLYVDVISYYHKIKNSYKENPQAYYSRKLNYNKKTGYIEINEVNNKYFIECVFNYSKIEVYVEKKHLVDVVNNICYILKSIKYNDKILESLIGENVLNYKEETFNIFNSKSSKDDFLDYVKEYDNEKDKTKSDEDIFIIEDE